MLNHLDLFSGIGCFTIAAKRQGFNTTQFVEIDNFCQQVLKKNYPDIPIHSDITTYSANLNQFDIITGGYPCQDLSIANVHGKGLKGSRSGLWFEYLRIINEVKPKGLIIENVPPTLNRNWLKNVLEGLSKSGYNAIWQTFKASDFGYPHQRKRLFIIAYSDGSRFSENVIISQYFNKRFQKLFKNKIREKQSNIINTSIDVLFKSLPKSYFLRVDDGFTNGLYRNKINQERPRIKALGNALIPEIAEFNLYILKKIITEDAAI